MACRRRRPTSATAKAYNNQQYLETTFLDLATTYDDLDLEGSNIHLASTNYIVTRSDYFYDAYNYKPSYHINIRRSINLVIGFELNLSLSQCHCLNPR